MEKQTFDTLSQATNALIEAGYKDGFTAEGDRITGSRSQNKYEPKELQIVETHRFDGMTNPADDTTVFAIEASDGNKGILVMSNSSKHDQNVELMKEIPEVG